jgi:hypothetical protein
MQIAEKLIISCILKIDVLAIYILDENVIWQNIVPFEEVGCKYG